MFIKDIKDKTIGKRFLVKQSNIILLILFLIIAGTALGIVAKRGYLHNFDLAVSHFIQAYQPM